MLKQSLILGSLISIALLIYVFYGLDWAVFLQTWQHIQISYLLIAALILWLILWLRAWRWLIISHISASHFIAVWQALNIGYLGNLIYPARAGEVMRVFAFAHLTKTPMAHSLSSSILDRLMDMLLGSLVLLGVLTVHGTQRFGETVLHSAKNLFIVLCLALIALLLWLPHWLRWIEGWRFAETATWKQRGQQWLLQALHSIHPLRHPLRLLLVLTVNSLIFALDYALLWCLLIAFGWNLPYMAAVTTGVFIMLGAMLPTAPGYIGIYQIAAVLGLGLYQIAEAQALAFSIVYQLMSFAIIGTQGGIILFYKGLHFNKASR